MPVPFPDPSLLKDSRPPFPAPVRSRTLPILLLPSTSSGSDGGVRDYGVPDSIFHKSTSGSVPPEPQQFSSIRPSPYTASVSTLVSSSPSHSLFGKPNGLTASEYPVGDDTPRPQFRHWRPHSISSFPPVDKFTLAGVLHSSVSGHQLNQLGYTNEINGDERNTTILPPYISPADSPTDCPSTPFPGRLQDTDGLGAMVRAQSNIDRTVAWGEKLRATTLESYVGGASLTQESQEEPMDSNLIGRENELANESVERSISAVMATESNSRSRKATQRLGLFRENEQAIEERGREKQRREEKEREKEKDRQEKHRAKETEREERKKAAGAEGKEQVFHVSLVTEAGENEKKLLQESSGPLSVSRTKDDRYSLSSCDELSASKAVPGDTPSPVSHFVPPDVAPVVSFDITGPAFSSSSSQSAQRSIDSLTVVVGSPEVSASIVAQGPSGDPLRCQDLSIELPRKPTGHVRIVPTNQAEDDEDDDEESDKDEISSALYFPHSTPLAAQDPTITPKKASSIAGQSLRKDIDIPRDDVPPTPRDTGPEFDLSIQSGEDEYHYHTERRNRTNTDDEYSSYHSNNEGYSSAASGFSEYSDSNDDFSGDEIDQDGSEIDTTPTATPVTQRRDPKHDHYPRSQTTNKSHSHSTPAGMSPQVPLGAVELKPYNHQVGGHTALFRFSRRAVCKSLSNRENEFYEAVEKRHPELLGFLPKWVPSLLFTVFIVYNANVFLMKVYRGTQCYIQESTEKEKAEKGNRE